MRFSIIILITLISQLLSAQDDVIIFPQRNSTSISFKSDIIPTHENLYLLDLPFYDDFASNKHVPDSKRWRDNFAYVNNGFSINNPITIGTASLDALDENGILYEHASSNSFEADFLTSLPINLNSYSIRYRSDKLYKTATADIYFSDSLYIYDKRKGKYVSAKDGYYISPADTLYSKEEGLDKYIVYNQPVFYFDEQSETKVSYELLYDKVAYTRNYSVSDSIFISFFCQAGGNGDMPEENDILILDFYQPSDTFGVFINEISKKEIEIYNATDSILDLKGYYLSAYASTESLKDSNKIVESTLINSYDFAKLSMIKYVGKEGYQRLFLFNEAKVLVDSFVSTIEISPDMNIGRFPDGASEIVLLVKNTLGEPCDNWIGIDTIKPNSGEFVFKKYQITDNKFLKRGFRFRFKNFATLSNDLSHARNEDIWNIDDVWLAAWRGVEKNFAPDISYVTGIGFLLNGEYTSIPTSHLLNENKDFIMNVPYNVVNKDIKERATNNFFSFYKTGKEDDIQNYKLFEHAFLPLEQFDTLNNFVNNPDDIFNINIPYPKYIENTLTPKGRNEYRFLQYFEDFDGVGAFNAQFRGNDTVRSSIVFDNYYAYDDGTAEAGFGLRNSKNAKCAYKFSMNITDTLRGVDIYFNNTLYAQPIYYNLCVWDVKDGLPNNLLAKKYGLRVENENGINVFSTILLEREDILTGDDYLIIEEGKTYFVGWEQTKDVLINIGVDLNNQLQKKIYYNTSYTWQESTRNIALMLRPIVGDTVILATETPTTVSDSGSIKIFPNPTQNEVFFSKGDKQTIEVSKVRLFDTLGKLLYQDFNTDKLQLQSLDEGVYIVVIEYEGSVYTERVIVKRF
ncbi:MAG: T9SS type A sorting domain-containing protein [Bacteroidales bacterium]|nr:T9SS type A sorting domain-containing protein [Bacteroidales bacterium]